jgi:hypothetical protein
LYGGGMTETALWC